jgi:hypothetical protein
MTLTHQDVYDCFGTTVSRDFFYMFAGNVLGAGEFRIVYEHKHRDDLVLKVEPHAQAFQNIVEWEFWEENKEYKRIARWLAPCEFISPCGIILAMKKTVKPQRADYPKKVPYFLTDLKRDNFGMLDGRLVSHDYGLYRVTPTTKRKKAKWWGDKT